jgi:hypothetical protein
MSGAAENWIAKGKETLGASPKKAGALGFLFLVLVILWGKLIFGGKGPSSASAMTPRMPGDDHSGNSAVDASGHSLRLLDSALLAWARAPIVPVHRNLFAVPLDYYPQVGSQDGDLSGGSGFWDRLAKSVSAHADQQEQRQILVDNVRIMAESLKLESTMLGSEPTAMVNSQMVREGDVIAGFHVLKIEARELIVEREGIRLAIGMQ